MSQLQTSTYNSQILIQPNQYQVQLVYCPYNSDSMDDSAWGCAWRSIQMLLSSLQNFKTQKFDYLFHHYGSRPTLESIFLKMKNLQQVPDYLQNGTWVPQEQKSGWAEPFIGQLILFDQGFNAQLFSVNGIPIHANAPKQVFEFDFNFDAFCKYLENQIFTNHVPVMIDDAQYAMVVYGIQRKDQNIILSIADPHIYSNVEDKQVGLYNVVLDLEGNQLSNTVSNPEQYMYTQSYMGIQFKNKSWMACSGN